MPGHRHPVGLDVFKALVALVLLALLIGGRPQAAAPTVNAAVDPSGTVTLSGTAPPGRPVRVTVTAAGGAVMEPKARSDDAGRWLTALTLAPGPYTVRAAIGPVASAPLRFVVPEPARFAPLSIDPPPSPAAGSLTLSGRAEAGRELRVFLDGRPLELRPPLVSGDDGRWSLTLELGAGGHTVYLAYAEAPQRVSDPLLLEVREAAPATPFRPAVSGGRAYVVQEGDWLSKLAETFLGDPARYPEIREATNAKAAVDDAFTPIANDGLIRPGERIWIPAP